MRILFLTIGAVYNFNNSGAYTDLLKRFAFNGHDVYVVGAIEKREEKPTIVTKECGINILRVKVGNITKTNLIEKGVSTLMIGHYYKKSIKRYYDDIKFDLILYTTPPITIASLVQKLKVRYGAYTYLLLKDIFPQNAVDIGILSKHGVKGIIYKYFRCIERKSYRISDKIGCMSPANVDFVKQHNPNLCTSKIEICPNTIDVIDEITVSDKKKILLKYGLPNDKYILLYGGNFGKPQNVNYIVAALKKCESIGSIHFVLCGSGTDFNKIECFCESEKQHNVTVIKQLPFEKYAQLIPVCDVGLLFLDYRFTIPNFPSRILDYMNFGLPVIAAVDKNTDVGKTIEDGRFGWSIESKNPENFKDLVRSIFSKMDIGRELQEKSRNARTYLLENFETERAYSTIISAVKKK